MATAKLAGNHVAKTGGKGTIACPMSVAMYENSPVITSLFQKVFRKWNH